MNTVVVNNRVTVDKRVVRPSKVVCVGRNYVEHIKELNNEVPDEMVLFVKPNSAISTELVSFHQEAIHYEAELCFVVENGQFSAVGLGLDLTKRGLQSRLKAKGLPWERAKAFDGSVVFSEFVAIESVSESLTFELMINDVRIQVGTIALMLNKPEQILAEIQSFMSLIDGDIVMTGTPKGVGVVNRDDKFNAKLYDKELLLTQACWTAQ
ncbi:fumarylacetoacetate hydrolase family protein [Shewanella psychropiezotolerans]|uniref:Fumarylacetoacetate hydrolase family protein n=1 Tax=Shewanella psychropiezotolerans TaxID=2593655 RepID=A0ABX5WXJ2_9GAMM|nr:MULTISPECIES: fumarylacetoacetate hydrolase family protein [Shewanella]MPY24794.1 fumarylacetoacetate hydrolase family protein [Shewanella sp. YLB-07]QDO83813.1 fumarylacetoacetate hydrolase family protein [Shewanella psychropiezotolerans]